MASIFDLALAVFKDVAYPKFCLSCGDFLFLEHAEVFCKNCFDFGFRKNKKSYCKFCGKPSSNAVCKACELEPKFSFSELTFFTYYNEFVQSAFYELKFKRKRAVAQHVGKKISSDLKSFIKSRAVDAVIPVPLSRSELKSRGFNQCEEILKAGGVSFESILEKEDRKRQSSLGLRERKQNVKGAFKVKRPLKAKRVLIFDDVLTTGSTADEVARVLLSSFAKEVYVYVVARVI